MDRTAAPWRVLDDTAPETAATAGAETESGFTFRPSWQLVGGVAVAAVFAIAAFVLAASAPSGEVRVDGGTAWTASVAPSGGGLPAASATLVVVDVQGAVLRPGVLRLVAGARVGDAIEAAGGYGPRVDAERAARELNLAAPLGDGDRILVPSRDDAAAAVGEPGAPARGDGGGGAGGLVDLNRASAQELDALPGIGPVTAQKIIDAREEQPLASVEDLLNRKVVGKSTFDKIRDLVTVR
jgi:competence protein ComEA